MKLNVISVFVVVTVGALIGMILGGVFGYFAGYISPDFFSHVSPWTELEPVAAATVMGAAAGVILGGGLGVFGILIQVVTTAIAKRKGTSN